MYVKKEVSFSAIGYFTMDYIGVRFTYGTDLLPLNKQLGNVD